MLIHPQKNALVELRLACRRQDHQIRRLNETGQEINCANSRSWNPLAEVEEARKVGVFVTFISLRYEWVYCPCLSAVTLP